MKHDRLATSEYAPKISATDAMTVAMVASKIIGKSSGSGTRL